MALVQLPANSVINMQVFAVLNSQRIITLFQYRFDGIPAPGTDYTDYMNDFYSVVSGLGEILDDLYTCMPSNYNPDFVRLQPVHPNRLRAVDFPWVPNSTPNSNPASTSNIATSIERFSKLNKRRGVGRVQLPIPNTVYSGGNVTNGAYITALNNLRDDIPTQVVTVGVGTAGEWNPVICNTSASQILISSVDGASVKTSVRTMHRRTVGLGI